MTADSFGSPKRRYPLFAAGSKRKVQRAHEHISNLDAKIREFMAGEPYTTIRDVDDDGLHEAIKIRLNRDIPEDFPELAGDALNNLRSALDLLACDLAIDNGHTDTKGVYFPFARDAKEFELPAIHRKIQKLSPADQLTICGLNPYEGGDRFLWRLNGLRNLDIHSGLLEPCAILRHITIDLDAPANAAMLAAPQWDSLKKKMIFATGPTGFEFDGKAYPAFRVAFSHPRFSQGEDAVALLQEFENTVKTIINRFADAGEGIE